MKRVATPILSVIILAASTLFTGCSQKREYTEPGATKYTSAARHRSTMRSYKVLGKRYHPTYV